MVVTGWCFTDKPGNTLSLLLKCQIQGRDMWFGEFEFGEHGYRGLHRDLGRLIKLFAPQPPQAFSYRKVPEKKRARKK